MWLSGRRAFRPDSGYYRNIRRTGLRRSRRRRAAFAGVIGGIIAIAVVLWLIYHAFL
jgi:hypothetical protein